MASTRRSMARSETDSVRPTSLAINTTQRFSLINFCDVLSTYPETTRGDEYGKHYAIADGLRDRETIWGSASHPGPGCLCHRDYKQTSDGCGRHQPSDAPLPG